MQHLNPNFLIEARKEKMKKLEVKLQGAFQGASVGERIECPLCHYTSSKNKFSAVLFKDAIKCFSCGVWRKL